ncbi:phosphoenolpyruvate--protein phosphotransferase [Aminiphilus sp.]|uniref:phosphoenolpyruvate--protein phosphotransferase n=1 Tax=Aminiphilus sp. TaxID=1872488 RepID=UPI002626F490|nr:phosphoenolpyruvate--protein phosphotransferase [Aminiphilus sp.]
MDLQKTPSCSTASRTLHGISLSPGYGVGPARIYRTVSFALASETEMTAPSRDASPETADIRFRKALEMSREQLLHLQAKSAATLGQEKAAVFAAQSLMLDDPMLSGGVEELLRKGTSPEDAVVLKTREIKALFESLPDPYLRERAADVEDVGRRIFRNLLGVGTLDLEDVGEPVILVAEDLTPSDTATLSSKTVAGILTERGGPTSHTAIIAKALEIPAVSGIGNLFDLIEEGLPVAIDGERGNVVLAPSEKETARFAALREKRLHTVRQLATLRDLPAVTRDGVEIGLWGNIAKPEGTEKVLSYGGTGVGLFRTEFLYMSGDTPPGEEEQLAAYVKALEGMKGMPTVIRTLDAGGDKEVPSLRGILGDKPEMNPFLGYRALRICLDEKDLFRTQLRALLRAAPSGDLRIMFPMVAGLEDLRGARKVLDQVRSELEAEGTAVPPVKVGIMIEIPAAAAMAPLLAAEADFFSVGTNDLTQYTLAADRMNARVTRWYDSFHPGVLQLLRLTAEGAGERKIELGMCGEMAGDLDAIPLLLGLGFQELSMTPSQIPWAKRLVRALSIEACRDIARKALAFGTAAEVRTYLQERRAALTADFADE